MKKLIYFLIILTYSIYIKGNAEEINTAAEFLKIGVGARALGMAGCFVGIADDASSGYWNPAGLSRIKLIEVSSVKLLKIEDIDTKYIFISIAVPNKNIGTFSFAMLKQSFDNVKIIGINGNNEAIFSDKIYQSSDNAYFFSFGFEIINGISFGSTIKILNGSYPGFNMVDNEINPLTINYTGFGSDFGILFDFGKIINNFNLNFGLNVQDVYSKILWEKNQNVSADKEEKISTNLKPGFSYKLFLNNFEFIVATDIDFKNNYQIFHYGTEIWWKKIIGIRGGLKKWGKDKNQDFIQQDDLSFGFSIRWYFLGFDYAYIKNELTPIQYISILGKF